MTWTYTPAILSTTPFMQVRLLIGDTDDQAQLKEDEEIKFLLTLDPSIWRAASNCCRAIAGSYSRDVDSVQGELRQLYSSRARAYLALAVQYANDAVTKGGGIPYAGGISIADKVQQILNSDRVAPQFNLGMDDDLIPGRVGNETPTGA